jgi:hypothetical protein
MILQAFGMIALLAVSPAPAAPQKQAPTNYNVGDPNERICEKLTIIGSRLSTKRVCATRAEWADRVRQDREAIEAGQKNVCVKRAGC